jgi:hypothetical protein
MGSRNISAVPAIGKTGKIPPHMPIQKNAEKRFYVPMKSAAVCVV